MKRFRLYHPGDASVAVVPRVGCVDRPVCGQFRVRLGAPAIGEAQLTGCSLCFRPPGAGRTQIT